MTLRLAVLIAITFFLPPYISFGADAGELRTKIEEKNAEISALEKEIARFQEIIDETASQADSLQREVNSISATISKLASEVNVTQRKIEATELGIEKIALQIADKNSSIAQFKKTLAEIIRNINEMESQSLVEIMLANASLSGFFTDIDHIGNLNEDMQLKLAELREIKSELKDEKKENEKLRAWLGALTNELDARKSIEENVRKEKDNLLALTRNREKEYQQIVAKKEAERAAFETELFELESALRVAIDPSSVPLARSGILNWPVKNPVITQEFGLTSFALTGAYGYTNGQPNPHRAIDLRASVGTPIFSALSGVVRGWGNTDAVSNCLSYGKWILIDHPNGLSTTYSHLSQISVSKSEEVEAGQLIGYSGNSGYSIAPHLHFSVFAQQGVQMLNIGEWYKQNGIAPTTACAKGGAIIPVAPPEAYLNPASYL